MTTDKTTTTKLLKNVDREVWKRFRAYCVAHDLNMGPAISALMLGVLMGKVKADVDQGVSVTSIKGSWHWPDDREAGTP